MARTKGDGRRAGFGNCQKRPLTASDGDGMFLSFFLFFLFVLPMGSDGDYQAITGRVPIDFISGENSLFFVFFLSFFYCFLFLFLF